MDGGGQLDETVVYLIKSRGTYSRRGSAGVTLAQKTLLLIRKPWNNSKKANAILFWTKLTRLIRQIFGKCQ
jgi:hypothetical protein